MLKSFFYTALLLGVSAELSAQQPKNSGRNTASAATTLQWSAPRTEQVSLTEKRSFIYFDGAQYDNARNFLPYYTKAILLTGGNTDGNAELLNPVYSELDAASVALLGNTAQQLGTTAELKTYVAWERKQPYLHVQLVPLRRNPSNGRIEKLDRFELRIDGFKSRNANNGQRNFAATSVLASGTWYRIGVTKTGIVKLDESFLKNTVGLDLTAVDPKNIRIYGNGFGMLPFENSKNHFDDLKEYAIQVQGENDGTFDATDYVLFYAQSPHVWRWDTVTDAFQHELHKYSDTTYYFLNADLGPGKRIAAQASSSLTPTHTVNTFNDYDFHEDDRENLIKSGREWFGEKFDIINSYSFSFNFPNIDVTSPAFIRTNLISRDGGISTYQRNIQSLPQSAVGTFTVTSVPVQSYYSDYAAFRNDTISMYPGSSNITVTISKQTISAIGWINFIEVNARRQLQFQGGQQLQFRDMNAVGTGNVAHYFINGYSSNTVVWDVTDPANVTLQQGTVNGSQFDFVQPSDTLKQFVAFDGINTNNATYAGQVPNQNLHGVGATDYIIVAHPTFLADANELAQLHQVNDGLRTLVVTPQQVYNEFSSGMQDVTAIRDFMKMFYDRATVPADIPKYLLLYGDGSYDFKYRIPGNTNFIPSFQNLNSLTPTDSYVSDEYFGLLDNNEGRWDGASDVGAVDIGIGRFPVQNSDESKGVLNKVKRYVEKKAPVTTTNVCQTNECSSFGDWRTWISFIGDDEDSGIHTSQSDKLATFIDTTYLQYNLDKIYLDAYQQEATPGGDRYPAVNEAITRRVEKGSLIINYTGHGGEVGLSHERTVEVTQINNWQNICNLPLFVTATCEFSRYDDPARTSAGEYVLLNPNGGGIGLFTTVRLVYSTPNFNLNKEFYECAFEPINGKMPTIGDIFRITKRNSGNSTNNRNFTLLGDPALRLAYPVNGVKTTEVNNVPVNMSQADTVHALSQVTIKGFVMDTLGNKITNYNGVLYPTVFDKATNITTLSNDGTSLSPPFTFKLQKNVLYKGKVSVVNGDFQFTFVVPKDIAYQYGIGRISYYADNGDADAAGWYENIVVGGSDPNAPADNTGPVIRLYMNDSTFASGGITNESPKLYAIVSDSNGVNTVGSGIGHDVVAVLDNQNDGALVLNDYYQADLNSFRSGRIIYPFQDLTEGTHTLSLKVWDVLNNSSVTQTEFVVAKSAELALDHVLNYPNPFTTKTQFFLGYNRCCEDFDVQVQVFTVSGKLVKTIEQRVYTQGYRSSPIDWDGKDDFGDKIGKGVYIYRVKVRSSDGKTAEKLEKLVVLN